MIERELTNLMYEILSNPERGRLYLELFDKHVLRLNMTADELDSAKVYGQYTTQLINHTRYIDLVIITNRRFIPIEVKIGDDYSEQDNQCYDYWREAEKYHKKHSFSEPPVLYYLTSEGEFPSEESAHEFTYIGYSNFVRSDKIDAVAFCSEGFNWIGDCKNNPPKDIYQKEKLELVYNEIKGMIDKNRTHSQRQVEKIMRKFFTALDANFDESFCKRYHLKRGSNRRGEICDYHTYRRYIDRFFGKAFAEAAISLPCTDSDGNIIKLAKDKYLCFYLGICNGNGIDEDLGFPTTLSASFLIFDYSNKECICNPEDIEPLLGGKNILPEEFVKNYDEKLCGMIGWTELHDANGNTIDFYYDNKTLKQFRTQEDIDRAVDNIMNEIKNLLRRRTL